MNTQTWKHPLLSLGVALLLGSQFGCSNADTLGGEAPDETIISGTPTWNNGVGEIMRNKCGTCHVVPATSYTPANAPDTLDLNRYNGDNVTVFGANVIQAWITSGLLEGNIGTVRKMPLDYATPLTSTEIGYLKTWASAGVPES